MNQKEGKHASRMYKYKKKHDDTKKPRSLSFFVESWCVKVLRNGHGDIEKTSAPPPVDSSMLAPSPTPLNPSNNSSFIGRTHQTRHPFQKNWGWFPENTRLRRSAQNTRCFHLIQPQQPSLHRPRWEMTTKRRRNACSSGYNAESW